MSNPLLETHDLSMRYGEFWANTDINITINPDTIHGVIGPNGAGKTTLFNCLAGTLSPSSGKIVFDGKQIEHLAQYHRPRLGIGRSFQVTSLFPDLTVSENLRLARQALEPSKGFVFWRPVKKSASQIADIDHVLERISLTNEKTTAASALSHGQQRLLEVGMALMVKPKLLMLDEPTSGMGIDDVPAMTELLSTLRAECTILLIEHNVGLVSKVCDVVTVMHGGKVLVSGTPDEISENEEVKTAYLGEEI
ncbi:MAG: ABC transporter ATP-binding protein [Granulosicoccus sp.]